MNMYCTYRQICIRARICMPLNNNYLRLRAVCGCWCCWRFRFFVVVAIYVDDVWLSSWTFFGFLIFLGAPYLFVYWLLENFWAVSVFATAVFELLLFLKNKSYLLLYFFIMLPPYFINAETSAINNLLAGLTALKLCNVSKLWQNNNSVYFCSIWDESISHSNIGSTDREKNY